MLQSVKITEAKKNYNSFFVNEVTLRAEGHYYY